MELGCSGYEIRGCPLPESTCARIAAMASQLQQHEATIVELGNLRDYCKVCPNCGAESDKGPYAPMDEEGCCLSCGADCSVEGLSEWAKEQERDLAAAQATMGKLLNGIKRWAAEEDGVPEELWETYQEGRLRLNWCLADDPQSPRAQQDKSEAKKEE